MGVSIGPEQGTDFYALALVARGGEHCDRLVGKHNFLVVAGKYYEEFSKFPGFHLMMLTETYIAMRILFENMKKAVGYLHPKRSNLCYLGKCRKAVPEKKLRQEKKNRKKHRRNFMKTYSIVF